LTAYSLGQQPGCFIRFRAKLTQPGGELLELGKRACPVAPQRLRAHRGSNGGIGRGIQSGGSERLFGRDGYVSASEQCLTQPDDNCYPAGAPSGALYRKPVFEIGGIRDAEPFEKFTHDQGGSATEIACGLEVLEAVGVELHDLRVEADDVTFRMQRILAEPASQHAQRLPQGLSRGPLGLVSPEQRREVLARA
jgi:hypothetical protein